MFKQSYMPPELLLDFVLVYKNKILQKEKSSANPTRDYICLQLLIIQNGTKCGAREQMLNNIKITFSSYIKQSIVTASYSPYPTACSISPTL